MNGDRAGTAAARSANLEAAAAIADDLMLFARLCDREVDAELLASLRASPVPQWFALTLDGPELEEACRLFDLAFATMKEPVDQNSLDDLSSEYAAIFLTHAYRTAPTESVWRDEEGLERQQAMFDVRAFYERFRVSVPDWRRRSDDHIVHELEFLAFLLRGAQGDETLREAALFMKKHLMVWVKLFASTAVNRCRLPFYAGLMLLMAAYLDRLASLLGATLGMDMTPEPLNPFAPATSKAKGTDAKNPQKTCGDPPSRYVPGLQPGW